MNSRKRVLSALKGEKVDRVPWIPLCSRTFFLSLPEYRKRFPLQWWKGNWGMPEGLREEELKFRVNFYKNIGADFMSWGGFVYSEGRTENVKTERVKKNNGVVVRHETPEGILEESFSFSLSSYTLFRKDFLIKEDGDYKILKYIMENGSVKPDFSKAEKFLEILGEDGVAFSGGITPPIHSWINSYLGIERLILELYSNKKELREIMEMQDRGNLEFCKIMVNSPTKIFLNQATWDIGLISPSIYQEYYLPFLRKYNQILHQGDKICLDHISGQKIKPFLKLIEETELDGLYGLVFPPIKGDISLKELIKRWKEKKIVPMAGLDPHFLTIFKPDEVKDMIKRIIEEVDGNPFILGTADDVVYGTPVKNLEVVSETIREIYG